MASSPYQQLEDEFRRLHAFRGALATLRWDAAVMMPRGSSEVRGEQLAALETECHAILTAPKVSRLIDRAQANAQGLEDWQVANLREMRRQRDHALAMPNSLVSRLAKASARAEVHWTEARRTQNFADFAPHLAEVVALTRDRAALLGQHLGLAPYDALVDEFSPGVLTADIDTILKAQGFTQGTVGARLNALFTDPKFIYPNTDAGKDQLIADLQTLVDKVQMRLPEYFGALPKAKLTIKRVPKFTEAGAPGGYYQNGALDGSRPGAYYINLRDTAEVPKWVLPTLTYHEGIPGHHLQLSIAQEAPLPLIRKVQFFSGYGEGWALYAEQLAAEMGMYADDPLGHVGQLKDAMFRSVRMVVDSGMHAMGWTREQAIDFGVKTLGDKESVVATEIERYCVWPGQACSYMIGKLTWLRLREKAKTALGPKFDIRKFHDAGLLAGAMPLVALENRIDGYIAAG